jgi:hypothetical protein
MNAAGIQPLLQHSLRSMVLAILTMLLCTNAISGPKPEALLPPHSFMVARLIFPAGVAVQMKIPAMHTKNASPGNPDDKDPKAIVDEMEQAFNKGNVNAMRTFLARKIFLNLFTGENGLYSSDQGYFILKNFFTNQPVKSFTITRRADSAESPYAVGILRFRKPGMRSTAQVFISLAKVNGEWAVNQITIALR